jgi:hypothetical protein
MVCRPIEEGDLNVKNLEIQNICLLKFIHKLHTSNQSSWARLILSFVYKGNKRIGDQMSSCCNSWQYLMSLINTCRNLTIVKLGNGRNIFFWLDSLLENKPLSVQYPTLSHVQNPNKRVVDLYGEEGWQVRFIRISSRKAENELMALMNSIRDITQNDEPDERLMRIRPNKHFSVKISYQAMNYGGTICTGNEVIWKSLAPKKCKIFA